MGKKVIKKLSATLSTADNCSFGLFLTLKQTNEQENSLLFLFGCKFDMLKMQSLIWRHINWPCWNQRFTPWAGVIDAVTLRLSGWRKAISLFSELRVFLKVYKCYHKYVSDSPLLASALSSSEGLFMSDKIICFSWQRRDGFILSVTSTGLRALNKIRKMVCLNLAGKSLIGLKFSRSTYVDIV